MISRDSVSEIGKLAIPVKYEVNRQEGGLSLTRVLSSAHVENVEAEPYRSRGPNCRRILVKTESSKRLVVEFRSFPYDYKEDVDGVIRVTGPVIEGDLLSFEAASFIGSKRKPTDKERLSVVESWNQGIRYPKEVRDKNGITVREGLRKAQLGALHAIASHWTLTDDHALVVMPTGTGKTEVMMAAAIDSQCDRLLVVVPSDALRSQTASRFASYGILEELGVISNLPFPIIGTLASTPRAEHLNDIKLCNVVVSTMSSLRRADEKTLARLTSLFSHVFFDEAHHIEAATWKRLQDRFRSARTLLLTATPFREDGKAIEGKIIYSFPLSMAQREDCFQPIRFIDVFEPDDRRADLAIGEAAVARLREDLENGFDHLLMARVNTIDDAETLFQNIYLKHFSDLNPVVVHSRSPGKAKILDDIRARKHRIVVCVNMFGEGFDLPQLKIAALHSVHKSLGITLQFIGRFTRNSSGVGTATFVANSAEDGVPEALESLYQEDADWNLLVADLSGDAIAPKTKLSDLVGNLRKNQTEDSSVEISPLALKPTISAHVFRTKAFHPNRYKKAFTRRGQRVVQAELSRRDGFFSVIVNQKERLDWTDSRDILIDTWDLYLAYFDTKKGLLFVYASRKGNSAAQIAKYIAEDPVLIRDDEPFKVFSELRRLTLHSVGLTSRSRTVRYQMFAGLDVRNAIDPVQQQSKLKSNITGVGYENGQRQGIGCSRKGKIWSVRSGSIADWLSWCDEVGQKLSSSENDSNDFLRHTLIPESISKLPASEALLADWPDQLFESSNFRFEVFTKQESFAFHECQVDLVEWNPGGKTFSFRLTAGKGLDAILSLELIKNSVGDDDFEVVLESGHDCEIQSNRVRCSVAEFFSQNPPLVRLADGSQLAGSILLKPQEELADTFERTSIEAIDWNDIDITTESRWKDGTFRKNSVQQHFIEQLKKTDATFIIDDDDRGEAADVIAIEENDDEIVVFLWHCKFSGGAKAGKRDKDLFVVCGQAQKSVKFTWSFERLVRHLKDRETEKLNGRPTRFVRGSLQEIITLRKSSRRRFIVYRIGIVQPGLSKSKAPTEHLAVVGSTNSFIQCVTGSPLLVVASD